LTNTPTFTPTPGQPPSGPVTIAYEYDPLYRLTEANYSTGDYYHYTYDAVGNRLSQTTELAVTSYQYDDANRLKFVNGIEYFWDDNGNLLNDGVNTYTYDSANRLISLSNQSTVNSYQYSGLGDRLSQTVNGNTTNYTLDLNTGLTQVLNDGTNTYLYGVGRIVLVNTGTEYFLGDALGSVRQLTDTQGEITLAKSYAPYGEVANSAGSAVSPFAFTGEQVDASGLTYLRARYYSSGDGRFLTRDTWMGEYNRPLSLNRWGYVEGNPVNYIDPSGLCGEPRSTPCPDWWNNNSHIYVEGYGYFDVQHLDRGWRSAQYMERQINAMGEGGGTFPMASGKNFIITYRIFANVKKLDKQTKTGIMYGIYMDFELAYEEYQARKIAKLDVNFLSAFSPEDLPSDHLGFWVYVNNGYRRNEIPDILGCLGEVTDRGPDIMNNMVLHASYEINDIRIATNYHEILPMIYGNNYYTFSLPKNYEFLPMVSDLVQYENGGFEMQARNLAWPSWLEIEPIPSGPTTWRRENVSEK